MIRNGQPEQAVLPVVESDPQVMCLLVQGRISTELDCGNVHPGKKEPLTSGFALLERERSN